MFFTVLLTVLFLMNWSVAGLYLGKVKRSVGIALRCTANDDPLPPTTREYIFGKDGEFMQDAKNVGIDPVRFIGYNLLALILALGANFVGITSTLMTNTNPELFRSLGVDQLYDIGGYRRYTAADTSSKYTFVFPSGWEQDRAVLARKLRLNERPAALSGSDKAGNTDPDVALGPVRGSIPRSNRNNVSVIKSKVLPGFSLRSTLGDPEEAARFLLANSIAPPSSGKSWELLSATGDQDEGGSDRYVFEYTVQKKGGADGTALLFNQHSISSITSRDKTNDLFTLTVVAPEEDWSLREEQARATAQSFHLVP
jgi:hypothetical protein